MRLQDLTSPNTPAEQLADVKRYAQLNYNKLGWDFVIETMTDEEIADVIGTRKHSRAAIMQVFNHIKPLHEARQSARAEAGEEIGGVDAEREAAATDGNADALPQEEPVETDEDRAAARRARKTALAKARREAKKAARAA